jgi:hypothetical protein
VNGGSYTNTKKINYTKKMSKNTNTNKNIDNSFSLFKKLNEDEFVYKYYKKEDDDTIKYFEGLVKYVELTRERLPQDSYLQNQVDTIVELIQSTLYKLKNLR